MAKKLLKPFEPGTPVAVWGMVELGTVEERLGPNLYRVRHPHWDARWPGGATVRRAALTPLTEIPHRVMRIGDSIERMARAGRDFGPGDYVRMGDKLVSWEFLMST